MDSLRCGGKPWSSDLPDDANEVCFVPKKLITLQTGSKRAAITIVCDYTCRCLNNKRFGIWAHLAQSLHPVNRLIETRVLALDIDFPWLIDFILRALRIYNYNFGWLIVSGVCVRFDCWQQCLYIEWGEVRRFWLNLSIDNNNSFHNSYVYEVEASTFYNLQSTTFEQFYDERAFSAHFGLFDVYFQRTNCFH